MLKLSKLVYSTILLVSALSFFKEKNWISPKIALYSNPNLISGVKKIQSVKFTPSYIQNISLKETATKNR